METPEVCIGAALGGVVGGASSSNEVLYKECVRNHTVAYPYNNMQNGHLSNLVIKDSRHMKSTVCCPITSRNILINQTAVKKTLAHTRIILFSTPTTGSYESFLPKNVPCYQGTKHPESGNTQLQSSTEREHCIVRISLQPYCDRMSKI